MYIALLTTPRFVPINDGTLHVPTHTCGPVIAGEFTGRDGMNAVPQQQPHCSGELDLSDMQLRVMPDLSAYKAALRDVTSISVSSAPCSPAPYACMRRHVPQQAVSRAR